MTPEERDRAHQRAWERGRIDYMGVDSFDNIQTWIEQFVRQLTRKNAVKNMEIKFASTSHATSRKLIFKDNL